MPLLLDDVATGSQDNLLEFLFGDKFDLIRGQVFFLSKPTTVGSWKRDAASVGELASVSWQVSDDLMLRGS